MLHLLAGLKVIGTGAAFGGAQTGLAHQARQGAIGHLDMVLVAQEFLEAHDIASAALKQRLDQGQEVLITFRLVAGAGVGLPNHPAYCAPGDLKQPTDLAQRRLLAMQR